MQNEKNQMAHGCNMNILPKVFPSLQPKEVNICDYKKI